MGQLTISRVKERARDWTRHWPAMAVEGVEILRAHGIVDKIDRARNTGDIVVIRLPAGRGQLRRRQINLHSQQGSDLAVKAMEVGGWQGFERPLPDVLVRTVRSRPGLFLDVGANSGLYALIAAEARPDVRVVAFEAFPPVVDVLRRNVALNGCGERVEIVPKAVADVCEDLSLYVPRSVGAVETSCSLDPNFKEDVVEEIKVPAVTLDSYWFSQGRPEVGAIKIDVEGTEHRVLLGAEELVRSRRPIVFYEFLPRGASEILQAFATRHYLVDVRLSPTNATIGEPIGFQQDAWNHAFVPREELIRFCETLQSAGLTVTQSDLGAPMSTAKRYAKQALLKAGRTPSGQRILGFYRSNGLFSDEPGSGEQVSLADHAELLDNYRRLTDEHAGTLAERDRAPAERDLLQGMWDRFLPSLPPPTYEDLTEVLTDDSVPLLDRPGVDLEGLTEDQRQWVEQGYVLKKRFIPNDLLEAYWKVRSELGRPGGWAIGSPYMHVPEVLDLSVYRPLTDLLESLIGEPMAVNLNLTGLVSTERNWHQDDYLNAPFTKGWYAAVWFAIGDVDPDSGPFEFVPGSHRWPLLRRDRILLFLDPSERTSGHWPKLTERLLDGVMENEIAKRNGRVEKFIGEKGDVLIWHARLFHRGSRPNVPGRLRMGFISHYTGLNHWGHGPKVGHHAGGGMYFLQDVPLDA